MADPREIAAGLTEQAAEIERLREALARFGQHRPNCNAARALPFEIRSGVVKCTCGLIAALGSDDNG